MPAPKDDVVNRARIVQILETYLTTLCEELEASTIREFPSYEEIFENRVINTHKVAEYIAFYEYDRASEVRRMSDIIIKKTQSRIFLHKSMKQYGDMSLKDFSKDVNFYLARMQDIETTLRVRIENSDKAITSLRSIQSNSQR